MKRYFKYFIFIIWITVWVLPIAYYVLSLRFPKITGGIIGYLVLFVPIIFPCLFLCVKKRNVVLNIIFVILFSLSVIYVYCSTLGFEAREPVFYPLISQTNKVSNYLEIDNGVLDEENEKMLRDVFPKSIPEEATEITYDYFYGAGDFSISILAKWKMPYEIYNKYRNDYKSTELKKIENAYIYTKYSNTTSCFCSVTFYDDNQTIEYKFQQDN